MLPFALIWAFGDFIYFLYIYFFVFYLFIQCVERHFPPPALCTGGAGLDLLARFYEEKALYQSFDLLCCWGGGGAL